MTEKKRRQYRPSMDRWGAFLDGTLSAADLDDEEVWRGELRNKNGGFSGNKPKMLPRAFFDAMKEEQARRFHKELTVLVPKAIHAIGRVLDKKIPDVGDSATVAAAFKTLERFAGKVPDNIMVKTEVTKFEQVMKEVVVVYEENPNDEGIVIDAESGVRAIDPSEDGQAPSKRRRLYTTGDAGDTKRRSITRAPNRSVKAIRTREQKTTLQSETNSTENAK